MIAVHPEMLNPCATCMFNMFTCGTINCFPTSASGKVQLSTDGETAAIIDNKFCWCCAPSPIPCCMGCGYGPCAQKPKFKKESATKYVGTGESQLGDTGMCTMCCHNKGDYLDVTADGIVWHAGNSPFYPPCLQGKDVVKMKKSGGGPSNAEMQR